MKKKYNPDNAVLDDEEQLYEKHFDEYVPGTAKERDTLIQAVRNTITEKENKTEKMNIRVTKRDHHYFIHRKGKSLARIIPLESDNSQDNDIRNISPQQKSLLEEMEGLPVFPINCNPTDILRSMREEKRMTV